MVGLIVAGLGSAVFFSGMLFAAETDTQRLLGDLLFLGAALCWSIYTLLGRWVLRKMDLLVSTAHALWIGVLVLVLVEIPDYLRVEWAKLGPSFWLNQLYLGLGPTALSYSLWYYGIHHIGAARAASFMFLVPISGLVPAALLLADTPTWIQLPGAVLMLCHRRC